MNKEKEFYKKKIIIINKKNWKAKKKKQQRNRKTLDMGSDSEESLDMKYWTIP